MSLLAGQVVCPSNAATAIVAVANSNTVYVGKGSSRNVVLTNPSSQGIYLGGDNTVTSSTGYLLATNASVTMTIYPGDAIYGKGASSSPTVHYMVTGA